MGKEYLFFDSAHSLWVALGHLQLSSQYGSETYDWGFASWWDTSHLLDIHIVSAWFYFNVLARGKTLPGFCYKSLWLRKELPSGN